MKKIHLILNAHIDPIWLWPWEAGLDEVMATCRSACDRLDTHSDLVFTRGEAWVYQQVEIVDPELFARIRAHIEAGRWEIVGGWWIQPDCNQPSGWAMEKQIALGKQYFQNTFGTFPRIGYNVDSFGHAATLPGIMRQAGQDRYIMMRPGRHELDLPSPIFRWRGYEDGPEVVTFRIPSAYCTRSLSLEHFQACIANLPDGISDTMCFVGVGDHGGGPTEEQIAWCREHALAIEGWKMVFSSPSRFFDAIADKVDKLPLVTGELQMHAIGCFSVYRSVKIQLRRVEHLLAQAEIAAVDSAAIPSAERLKEAWEEVCFHAFHDTLGGTCIPSAYAAVSDQLGLASTIANKTIAYTFRRKLVSLPDDLLQRIALWNPSANPFRGYFEFEPWLEGYSLGQGAYLIDEAGNTVEHQLLEQEALTNDLQRLLFPVDLAPGQLKTLRIARHGAKEVKPRVTACVESLSNDLGIVLTRESMDLGFGIKLPIPAFELIQDDTDTWSHGADRYSTEVDSAATWLECKLVDSGPLMASWIERGAIGKASEIIAEWRVYAGEPYISLDIRIDYRETHRVLKMSLLMEGMPQTRVDGIMGGKLTRSNNGHELPIRDWCNIGELGVVCPDVYAADATRERLRLTLLRSPLMAHHDPHAGEAAASRYVYADQGVHHFRFRFYGKADADLLDRAALAMESPPVAADLTRGMPMESQI